MLSIQNLLILQKAKVLTNYHSAWSKSTILIIPAIINTKFDISLNVEYMAGAFKTMHIHCPKNARALAQ